MPLQGHPVRESVQSVWLQEGFLDFEDHSFLCLQDLTRRNKLFRSEMICRVEEAKHEMESRLDSQRRHMVQKESILQNEIEELKVNTILFFFFFLS